MSVTEFLAGARGRRPALIVAMALLTSGHMVALRAATPQVHAIVIDAAVRDSMNAIWTRSNTHWNELAEVNTLTQMLGTGKPTQREYLGCLSGYRIDDTIHVTGTEPARDMKQLQFAVSGDCDSLPSHIGSWHTHPYRADSAGRALKEPTLSPQDLETFARGGDAVVVVIWDRDSLDAAMRAVDGSVVHPAPVVVR